MIKETCVGIHPDVKMKWSRLERGRGGCLFGMGG